MKKLQVLVLLFSVLFSANAVHAKKVILKYKLEKGAEFTLVHTMEQEITQEVMGQSQVIESIYSTRYVFKVLKIDADGNYLIEEQVDGMTMKMENEFMNLDYDSDDGKEAPEVLKSLSDGLHIPVTFLLSPQGKVIEVIDAEEYVALMQKALGSDGNPMASVVTGMASQLTSIEGIKNQLDGFFFNYPAGKTKVGKTWEEESQSTQMVKFKNIVTNTLVEADKEKATIKQAVQITQMESSEGMEMQGMMMTYELSGRKESGNQIDLDTGIISKVDAVTEISGIVSIESPQLPTPMSIPMTIKLTETIEQLK